MRGTSVRHNDNFKSIHFNGAPLRAFIFDMDGVIADTKAMHQHTWEAFLREEGFTIDMDEFMRFSFGRGNRQVVGYLYPDRANDFDFLDRKGEEKEKIFCEMFRQAEPIGVPGVVEFIQRARELGIGLALGSSAPRGNVETVLAHLGIRDCFPVTVTGQDVALAKPDPAIFLKCVEQLGVPASECLVFEDSLHGLEAAKRAGNRAIAILTMHTAEETAHLSEASTPDFLGLRSGLA